MVAVFLLVVTMASFQLRPFHSNRFIARKLWWLSEFGASAPNLCTRAAHVRSNLRPGDGFTVPSQTSPLLNVSYIVQW